MKRDEEIQRLMRYAQGMGLSVRFKPYVKGSGDGGGWTTDGSEITVYVSSGDSKTDKILTLIHEIAHHKGFIENNRTLDPKMVEALEDEDEKKRSRKRIYLDELSDTQYWEQIYKDTGCEFGLNKLYVQRDFDVWCYEFFYEEAKFPTCKAKKEKMRQLKDKYGSKK